MSDLPDFDPDSESGAAFLSELTELCNKYRVDIFGCGCCGSPNVISTENRNPFTCSPEGSELKRRIDLSGLAMCAR